MTLDLRVSMQEKQYLENTYINTLIKKKKVEFLIKSSQFMLKNCIPFDSRCRNVYNMSIAYLIDEKKDVKNELEEQKQIIVEAKERIDALQERLEYIETGVNVEIESKAIVSIIPELSKSFKCQKLRGWNYYRGVFVDPDDIKDLPFTVFVKEISKLPDGGNVIALEAGDYTVNFSYVEKPLVKKGEVTGMGKPFFQRSAGNPVMPGKILVFIAKNKSFVNPVFMCR
jgi:hypothetical protein